MCDKCDQLEVELQKEKKRSPKISNKNWWLGIGVTIAIFIVTQIFIYGKMTGEIGTHLKNDPTHKQLTEEFLGKEEFNSFKDNLNKRLDLIIKLLDGDNGSNR